MFSSDKNQFRPDYVPPPGETLVELLAERDMSQSDLAERTGRPKKTINEIVKVKAAITADTALQFERVLGVPASFWSALEQDYRDYLARQEEGERLASQIEWVKSIPVTELVQRKLITKHRSKVDTLRDLLSFFAVASPEQWEDVYAKPQLAFRRSSAFEMQNGALSAWLRQGEILASHLETSKYDRTRFKEVLQEARRLTTEDLPTLMPRLTELCASSGVALVFVPQYPKVPVSGVTRWLTPDKALIQLSLRYKSDDQFWFTFFHEAGHILLHGKKDVFLEVDEHEGKQEVEANRFAADLLVPPVMLRKLAKVKTSKENIKHFARELGVSPGIVVGRLQHAGMLPRTHCNDLKVRYDWSQVTTR